MKSDNKWAGAGFPTCGQCAYFFDYRDANSRGECRFNPPIVNEYGGIYSAFPWVEQRTWCGKFLPVDGGK